MLIIIFFIYVTKFVIFSLFIFPRAGPDIKYLLGFIRTQLSTTTTIVLVFGPKVKTYFAAMPCAYEVQFFLYVNVTTTVSKNSTN